MQAWILGFCGASHSRMKSFNLVVDDTAMDSRVTLGDFFFAQESEQNIHLCGAIDSHALHVVLPRYMHSYT